MKSAFAQHTAPMYLKTLCEKKILRVIIEILQRMESKAVLLGEDSLFYKLYACIFVFCGLFKKSR